MTRAQRLLTGHALAGVLCASLLSLGFFVRPLRPWPDQGWTLEAATRHARGLGLTTSLGGAPNTDLSDVRYSRLAYFPPIYPLVISWLLRHGLHVDAAVKLVNATCLVIGVAGWCALGIPLLRGSGTRWLYTTLLVVAAGAVVPKGGTTDYAMWALLPYWLLLLRRAGDATKVRGAAAPAIAASAVAAVVIGVRWAGVLLVPAGALFVFVSGPTGRALRARIAVAACYAAPAAGVYAATVALNRHYGGAGSLLGFLQPGWAFDRLLTLYPLEALSTVPLGLKALLGRGWRWIEPEMSSPYWGGLFRGVLPALVLAPLLWAQPDARDKAEPRADFARPFLIVSATTLLFLGYMTVRFTWPGVNWSYLDEPRYFRPLWPAALLFWLLLLERRGSRMHRAFRLLVWATAAYLLQAEARNAYHRLSDHEESWELIERVRAIANDPGLHIVCDQDISDYIPTSPQNVIAVTYPEPTLAAKLHSSRAATLWLVRRLAEPPAYETDPLFYVKRFEAMRARFGASRAWASSRGNYELFTAELSGTGSARSAQ